MSWLTTSKPILLLTLIALVSIAILSRIEYTTRQRIAENELAYKSAQLRELLTDIPYDNEPWTNTLNMLDTAGKPITIYPVVAANTLVAMVLETNDTQGYVAPIRLLTAIQMNTAGEPTIIGVRVAAHRETPGLGDKIEITRSDWLRQFAGRSLNAMATEGWAIRKDGGGFDQISGATVTSRAVVAGVNRTLETLANNQQAIKSQLAID